MYLGNGYLPLWKGVDQKFPFKMYAYLDNRTKSWSKPKKTLWYMVKNEDLFPLSWSSFELFYSITKKWKQSKKHTFIFQCIINILFNSTWIFRLIFQFLKKSPFSLKVISVLSIHTRKLPKLPNAFHMHFQNDYPIFLKERTNAIS